MYLFIYIFIYLTSNNNTIEGAVRKLMLSVILNVVGCFNCRTFFQLQENVTAFNIQE